MTQAEPLVDLVEEAPDWETALPDLEDMAQTAARLALTADDRVADRYTLCLLACDDARIAILNADFRGKPQPTNVLSWPAFAGAPPRPGADEGQIHLGDVAIALETTRKEAEEAAIPLKDHVIHLILHGCLHLLGYDHMTEAEADHMEGIESRALISIGLADPYRRGDAHGARSD